MKHPSAPAQPAPRWTRPSGRDSRDTLWLTVSHGWWLFLLSASVLRADFQGSSHLIGIDDPPVSYAKTQAVDPIARLQRKIDAGEVTLRKDPKYGYYPSLLEFLNIPVSSQVLVFSKTSFQRDRISASSPRAVYFNDDVYVGFVKGSEIMEVSSVDPQLGGVFYTLDQSLPKPKFVRNDQCLECHQSAKTMGSPGHLVRSFVTEESGQPDLNTGVSQVNHRTPFQERWGGWYVSGQHGKQIHRGNLLGAKEVLRNEKEPNFRANLDSLRNLFDTSAYLLDTSDVVALMILEHQSHMHNFLTRLNHSARIALSQYGHVRYLKSPVEAFLRYLFFVEEAPLTDRVSGSPEYARAFQARGPKDSKGRSLRELDLRTRLFKYPCSYLIYSGAFTQLPAPLKDQIYARMLDVLTGAHPAPEYAARLAPETRQAILEILVETQQDLPAAWRAEVEKGSKLKASYAR
ncbi:MAG: hypothetical protein FJ404_07830 [Verrucomicrobia bacterium]|nr:hypothetical protein [Verrucomicrobiota bacterium]